MLQTRPPIKDPRAYVQLNSADILKHMLFETLVGPRSSFINRSLTIYMSFNFVEPFLH